MPDVQTSPRPQRRAAILLLAGVVVVLAGILVGDRVTVPIPAPDVGPRAGEVVHRIDPNTAPVAVLSALPMIGDRRARNIVAYRASATTQPAFAQPEDLMHVPDIGPGVVRLILPYLEFRAASSQPGQ
jgi:hypothetical protein